FLDRFDGAAEIGLDNDVKLFDFLLDEVFECERGALDLCRLVDLGLTALGNGASQRQFGQDLERIVGVGDHIQTGDADWNARSGLLDRAAQVIVELPDTPVGGAAYD